jgi:hypothetical protein
VLIGGSRGLAPELAVGLGDAWVRTWGVWLRRQRGARPPENGMDDDEEEAEAGDAGDAEGDADLSDDDATDEEGITGGDRHGEL